MEQTTSNADSSISTLFKSVATIAKDFCNLATLELHLAGKSLVSIITLSLMLFGLLIAFWFCLLAILAVGLIKLGLGLEWSLLLTALANIIIAIPIVVSISKLKHYLTMPATRKHLFANGKNYEATQTTAD